MKKLLSDHDDSTGIDSCTQRSPEAIAPALTGATSLSRLATDGRIRCTKDQPSVASATVHPANSEANQEEIVRSAVRDQTKHKAEDKSDNHCSVKLHGPHIAAAARATHSGTSQRKKPGMSLEPVR